MLIITFTAAIFMLFCYAAFRAPRSGFWKYVDVIYYPLAAVGVVLLFANNAAVRQDFELEQRMASKKAELQAIVASKPNVEVLTDEDLMDASFRLMATVSNLADVCLETDPECMVAKNLKPAIDRFLSVANEKSSAELRLSHACGAAETLLKDIRSSGRMSSYIADDLLEQYANSVRKQYGPLAYDAIVSDATVFEASALKKVASLTRAVSGMSPSSQSMKTVLGMRAAEARFGKVLLLGLFPCIVAPRTDIERLANWTSSRETEEQAISQLQKDRERLKQGSLIDPRLRRLHLTLWPFILVTALAVKFGKGVAATMPTTVTKKNEDPAQEGATAVHYGNVEGASSTEEASG